MLQDERENFVEGGEMKSPDIQVKRVYSFHLNYVLLTSHN